MKKDAWSWLVRSVKAVDLVKDFETIWREQRKTLLELEKERLQRRSTGDKGGLQDSKKEDRSRDIDYMQMILQGGSPHTEETVRVHRRIVCEKRGSAANWDWSVRTCFD